MKYQRIWRTVVYLVCAGILLCLAGCSTSFCGLQLRGKEELTFFCGEAISDETEEIKENRSVWQGEQEQAETSEQLNGQNDRLDLEQAGGKKEQESGFSANETAGSDGKININSAGAEELMTLNGIGETRAKAIIEYRTQNGLFTKEEDIMLVPGIKEGIFSKIQNQIAVD